MRWASHTLPGCVRLPRLQQTVPRLLLAMAPHLQNITLCSTDQNGLFYYLYIQCMAFTYFLIFKP